MHISSLAGLFGSSASQARARNADKSDWTLVSQVARELAGLVGLLAWLGVLFYLTVQVAA